MKKILISAAAVAAVGISAYLGFRPDPTPALTELQLANAEALADDYVITDGQWLVLIVSPTRWKCFENGEASCPGTKL